MRITRLHVTGIGLSLVVAGLAAVALRPRTEAIDAAEVVRAPLQVTVDEEGRTRVRNRFVVSSPVGGRILRINREPGETVRRGDVLARLRPDMAPLLDARTRAEAEAAVQNARAGLGRARAEQTRSTAALAHATREQRRSSDLIAEGLVSAQEFEARGAEARQMTELAQAAAFAVQAAEAEVRRAEARLHPSSGSGTGPAIDVRSPTSGAVLRRFRESESVVPAGEPLLEVGDVTQLEIVADLLSTDAARVPPHARALIEQPGAPPRKGRVRRVEPAGFTKVSALGVEEQRVNVVLDLDTPAEGAGLGDAYRVDVRIVIWESANVLVVPASALFRDGSQWATFVVVDGRSRKTPVTIGHHGGREVEVLAGLAEGSRVILHPGDRVADGTRVIVRPR